MFQVVPAVPGFWLSWNAAKLLIMYEISHSVPYVPPFHHKRVWRKRDRGIYITYVYAHEYGEKPGTPGTFAANPLKLN
jgi:hypothetical protein